ncbi:MAG: protein kinase, partial [Bdellovibrionota bacterium]
MTDILGEGGAGRVFQGYRVASDIKVPYAIKILLEENLTSLRYLNQFREEALLVSRLKHPNVGTFIEFFEFHGQNAIVLEYIEGVGLGRL